MTSAIEQFSAALAQRGIIAHNVIADGELHRADVNVENGRQDAAYVLHLDGMPAGGFENHRDGLGWENWKADVGRSLSVAELNVQRSRIKAAKRKNAAAREARRAEARRRANHIWREASPANGHAYLKRKGVSGIGARQRGQSLVLPLCDDAGELHSLQFVGEDGRKLFLRDGQTRGHYLLIGEPTQTICIAEGYATGLSVHEASANAVAVAYDCGNLEPVAVALRKKFPKSELVLCADDDCQTPGNPGLTKATEAARAVGGLLAVPAFGPDRPDSATDFNDLAQYRGAEAVARAVANAKALDSAEGHSGAPDAPAPDQTRRVAELAVLPVLDYEQIREGEAKRLGMRVSVLDAEVRRLRSATRGDAGVGQPLQFAQREPWSEPVDGAALLDSLAASARRYLILLEHADVALALWVVFTYILDAVDTAPILAILSPEKQCGKTTALDWLSRLVHRHLATSNILPAALFRSIEKWRPTLLIDEADSFLRENDELRGVLNSGHTRATGFVIRTVGEEHEPRQFSTWGAKAIALIGKLPDTLADRSIPIQMRRKLPSERVHKLRGRPELDALECIACQCARFAADNLAAVKEAEPQVPEGLSDRAADGWTPLLAIADVAGGRWPMLAREAASVLSGATPGGDSLKVELLRDVRGIFTKREVDRIASSDLVEALVADPERPWAEYNHGKAITQRQLARLLGAFGIVSGPVRLSEGRNLKGYKIDSFADAFARYLPPSDPSHSHEQGLARVVTDRASVTEASCDGSLYPSQASIAVACDGVTDQEPPWSEAEAVADADATNVVPSAPIDDDVEAF